VLVADTRNVRAMTPAKVKNDRVDDQDPAAPDDQALAAGARPHPRAQPDPRGQGVMRILTDYDFMLDNHSYDK